VHSCPVVPNARGLSTRSKPVEHQSILVSTCSMRALLRSAAGVASRSSRVGYNSSTAPAW
jgi:hypothetical protein